MQLPLKYRRSVTERIRALVTNGKKPILDHILPLLEGAPPEIALNCYPALTFRPPEETIEAREAARVSGPFEPHPLDYDWRFTGSCCAKIAEWLVSFGLPIVLIGVPGLAGMLKCQEFLFKSLDRNPGYAAETGSNFETADVYLQDGAPVCREEVAVFLDPPWYPNDVAAWMNFVRRKLPHARVVAFSLWRSLIRPAAARERKTILAQLAMWGDLHIARIELSYDVPFFEHLAYAERGIGLETSWRRGDLFVIKTDRRTDLPPPATVRPGQPSVWRRFLVGRRQLAIRERPGDRSQPEFLPLGAERSWHLDSVSRREPRHGCVDLWTSNNVVAEVRGTETVVAGLDASCRESSPAEHRKVLTALQRLGAIQELHNERGISWRHRG